MSKLGPLRSALGTALTVDGPRAATEDRVTLSLTGPHRGRAGNGAAVPPRLDPTCRIGDDAAAVRGDVMAALGGGLVELPTG